MKLISREIFGYSIFAIVIFAIISMCSCSNTIADKNVIVSDAIYEQITPGDTLTQKLINILDEKAMIIGNKPDEVGIFIIYPYKDTMKLIMVDSKRIVIYKGNEIKY